MTPESEIKQYTIPEFAERIRKRFPQYKDLGDNDLTDRILKKHPGYKSRINFGTVEQAEASVAKARTQFEAARNAYTSAGGQILNPAATGGTDYFRPLTTTEKAAQKRGEPVIISESRPQIAPATPEMPSRARRVTEPPVSLAPVVQGRLEAIQKQNRQKEIQQKVQQARQVRERAQGLVLPKGQRNQGAAYQPKFGLGQTYREVPKLDKTIPNLAETLAEKPLTFEQDRAQRAQTKREMEQLKGRAGAASDFQGEEYQNFLRLNRTTDSPRRRDEFLTLKAKQRIAEHGSIAGAILAEDEESARRQRVAQMGKLEYAAQLPKGPMLGVASGAGTALKGLAVASRKIVDQITDTKGFDTQDAYVYRLGEAIEQNSRALLRSNPDLEQEFFVGKAPEALGQSALFLLGGWASKSPKLAISVLGGTMTAGDAYEEVRALGGSDEEAVNAGLLAGAILGPTELIGTRGLVKALEGTVHANTLRSALKTALTTGSKEGLENSIQEIGQEAGQGLITGNPRSLAELAEAGALGGIAGLVGTGTTTLGAAGIDALRNRGQNIVSDYLAASPLSTPEEKAAVEQASAPDQKPDVDPKKPNVLEPIIEKPQQIAPDQLKVVESPGIQENITETITAPEVAKERDIIPEKYQVPPEVSLPVPTVETPAEVKTQPSATESQLPQPKEAKDVTQEAVREEGVRPSEIAARTSEERTPVPPSKGAEAPSKPADAVQRLQEWGTRLKTIAQSKDLNALQALSDEMAVHKDDPRVARLRTAIQDELARARQPEMGETATASREEELKSLGYSQETIKGLSPQQADEILHKHRTASWVIRDKTTGEVVMETFDKKKVEALNTKKYEAVPIGDYLAKINSPKSTTPKLSKTAQKALAQAETPEGKTIRPAPTHRIGAPKPNASRNSLEQQVRAYGGVRDDVSAAYAGEIKWLKESSTRGTVNQTGGISVEQMATKLAQDGYGKGVWWEGAPNNVDPQAFLQAVMDDTRGIKQYSTERDEIEDDPDVKAWDALVEGAGAELIERVSSGRATAADIVTLTREAQANGLSDRALDAFIGGLQDAVSEALPESTETGEGYSLDEDGTLLDPDGTPLFSRAFHGSPYEFDKFSTEKIGTGEGAQSYGYGLYFTDKREIADYYRSRLANDQPSTRIFVDGVPLITLYKNDNLVASAIGYTLERNKFDVEKAIADADTERHKAFLSDLRGKSITSNQPGRTYEVELAPKEDEYLLWDKPLSEQGEKTFSVLDKEPLIRRNFARANPSGEQLYKGLEDLGHVMDNFGRGPKGVSEYLHSLGIRGIKYLDQGSRAEGKGSYNYVIFSENDVEIVSQPQFARQLPLTSDELIQEQARPKETDQRERLRREQAEREEAADPLRAAALRTLAELKRRGLSIDEYARQGVLFGAGPSAEEIKLLKEVERGAADSGTEQPSMFARGETGKTETRFEVKGNQVSLGLEGAQIITDIHRELGLIERFSSGVRGVFERKGDALARNLDILAKRGRKGAKELAGSVRQAAKAGNNKVVLYYGERARKHEMFHEASESADRLLRDRHSDLAGLVTAKEWPAMRAALVGLGYPEGNLPVLVEEAAAFIAEGRYEELGLTREQAVDWMTKWFDSFSKKNPHVTPRQFQEMSDEATQARDEVYRTESALREPLPNEALPGVQERREGRDRESIAAAREPASEGKPLTEKQFYRSYYQHKILRKDADLAKLQSEGWKGGIGPQALPASRGGEPSNVVERNYGVRAGDTVLLVPKEFTYETPNGTKIKEGWKPADAQIVVADRDFQPAYELYLKGLDQSDRQPADITQTEAFKQWFGDSKVVDGDGKPLVVYSGHSNMELYGERFDPKRSGGAGAFYATESTEIASNYANSKLGGQGEFHEGGSQYRFKLKNGKWGKKIWQIELTPEQQDIARQFINTNDEGEQRYDIEEYWKDNARYDKDASRALARGGLRDLQSIWQFLEYMGDNIAYAAEEKVDAEGNRTPYYQRQRKNTFELLLDRLGIEWQSADWAQPGVFPVYLRIRNPIDAEKPFPQDLLAELKKAAKRTRMVPEGREFDEKWTSDYPLRQWVQEIEEGNEYWSTQVPKKAIPIIKKFGYDGIKEVGMKGEPDRSKRQINWIAFDSEQIKSATGNRGTFDPNDPNILMARSGEEEDYQGEHAPADAESGAPLHDLTANAIYPDDVYGPNGLRYYPTGYDALDREAYSLLQSYRDHPGRVITVYRAVPKDAKGGINAGDWVTPIRGYAVEHGKDNLGGDYKIQKKPVFARDIYTDGNSWLEWGYDPQPFDAQAEKAARERRRQRARGEAPLFARSGEAGRIGQPIDRYEGSSPKVDWEAVDNYGKWTRQSVAKHLEVPSDSYIYQAMVDLGSLTPSRVEQTAAAELREGEGEVDPLYLEEAETMLEEWGSLEDYDYKFEEWRDALPWAWGEGYDAADVETLAREMQARNEESSYPEEEFSVGKREFPPIVVTRKADGSLVINDGNHRADIWSQQGYDVAPAWVNDELARGEGPLFARSGDPWSNLTELSDEFGRLANEPELAPGEKPLSLPQTLKDAGLEAGPARGYLPESIQDDGLKRAKQVISEKGIDGAIEFVKTGDGIEWASTGYEVSARLREEESKLRAEGKAEEADKTRDRRLTFLDDFASAAVERGRSIVGIKAISEFAPDRMAYALAKASRKKRKRGLTPEEESKITKLGEELGLLEERNKELEKRLAEASARAQRRAPTKGQKAKKTDYQSKLEQQASTVLQTLKPKLGKLDFSGFAKKGESGAAGVPTLMPPLPGDAELIAQYAAAQLARFNTVSELNAHLLSEFGQDIDQFLPKIRQRAYAIRQQARLAEMEASDTEPKRRKTILSEIQKEISESLTAIREAQKAQERAVKAEKAAQAKSERMEARLEAKQARESEHEARKQEIKEARARLKQQRQEYKQASQAETKGYRETIKAQREAERKAELWDTPLRNAATEARERLKNATDPKDPQTADDLIAVAAEKFLPAIEHNKDGSIKATQPGMGAVDPSRVYRDLKDEFPALVTKKNQGDLYKKGYQRIQDATAAAREAARLRSASAESKRLWEELGIDVDAQAVLIQQAEVRRQTDELRRKAQAEFQRVSRTMIEKIWMEAQAIPRSLQSSIDAPIGRQGAYFLLTHPLETMKTAVPATLKGYGSIHVSDYIAREKELAQHPDYKLAVDSGLELSQTTGEGDPALVAEEQFQSSLASRFLPHVRLSEQGYVLGMNAQRLAMFSRLADTGRAEGYTPETNPEFFEAVARFVNDGTGRGNLPDAMKRASALLNFFFFSTRLNVSRLQLLNDLFNPVGFLPERANALRAVPGFASYDPVMRKVVAKELVRLGVSLGTVFLLASAMGIKVEYDLDDPDALLLRIRNTRYDVTGGEAGTIRFLYRFMRSIYRTAAEEDLQPFEQPLAIIGKFLRYKLAPLPSGTIDAITGKDAVGQPANLKKFESPRQVMQENVIIKRALPILAGNVLDTVTEEGWIGVPMVLPALAGFGVSSYPDRGIRAIKNQAVVDLLESLKITSNSLLGQKTKDEALDKVIQARIMEKVESLDIPQGATEVGKEKIVKERLAQIRNLARAEAAIAEPKLYADYLKSKEGSESVSVLTDEEKKTLTEQDLTNYRSRYAEAYVEMLQRASQAPNWSKLTDDEKEKVLARIPRIAHNRAKIDLVKTKRKGTP